MLTGGMEMSYKFNYIYYLIDLSVIIHYADAKRLADGGWETTQHQRSPIYVDYWPWWSPWPIEYGNGLVQIKVERAMDDDDWRYNYFLITIDVQVNPYKTHRTDRVTVEFRLDEIEPGYCDVIRYQPTTSPGTMSHSIGIGFILGIGGIGVSSSYTQFVTQPTIRVEDDSAIVPGKEDQRILWTTEYSYPRVQPSEHPTGLGIQFC